MHIVYRVTASGAVSYKLLFLSRDKLVGGELSDSLRCILSSNSLGQGSNILASMVCVSFPRWMSSSAVFDGLLSLQSRRKANSWGRRRWIREQEKKMGSIFQIPFEPGRCAHLSNDFISEGFASWKIATKLLYKASCRNVTMYRLDTRPKPGTHLLGVWMPAPTFVLGSSVAHAEHF